jgi:DNA-binding SARP family transcriptional activator
VRGDSNREVTVHLLGGFGVGRAGRRLSLRPSARRLIALLAIDGPTARSDAAIRLFEERTLERANANLRTILWRLREEAVGLVIEEADSLRVSAKSIDFHEVLRWSTAMMEREAAVCTPPSSMGRPLLPGWSEPWLIFPREHLHLLQLHALEASGERLLLAGRFGEAAVTALMAVTMDPLRETSNRLLIEVLIREGNVVDGLRRYLEYERLIASELHAKPGPAVQMLVAPLLSAGYVVPSYPPPTPVH